MGNVSDKKQMVIHFYQKKRYLYSENFSSITDMLKFLRSSGVKVKTESVCTLGDSSVKIEHGDKTYEIEEFPTVKKIISLPNGEHYIPLNEYSQRTGQTPRTVRYAYKQGKIKGISVGKRNYLYIYWETIK